MAGVPKGKKATKITNLEEFDSFVEQLNEGDWQETDRQPEQGR